jgi:hypothetical protein
VKKNEILALDDTELIAHALYIEMKVTKEENTRGVTQSTSKDYKWTLEEVANRFNLDLEKLKNLTASESMWDN